MKNEIEKLKEKLRLDILDLTGKDYEIMLVPKTNSLSPVQIIDMVCEKLNLDKTKFMGNNRFKDYIDGGFIAAHLIKKLGYGSSVTGVFLKYRPLDHSSVLYRWKQHDNLMFSDKNYRKKFEICCK